MKLKEEYKKLLASVLAASAIITMSGCARKNNESTKNKNVSYEIVSGDTLYDISYRYYGSYDYVDEIIRYNNINNPDLIKAGDIIVLPQIDNKVEESEDIIYTIKFGDTFYDICKTYYGRSDHEIIDKLAKYNNIDKPGEIQAGTSIKIPSIEVLNDIEIGFTFKLK